MLKRKYNSITINYESIKLHLLYYYKGLNG